MGERYLITGVQLGILVGTDDAFKRKILVDDIIEKQFLDNSKYGIEFDVEKVRKLMKS